MDISGLLRQKVSTGSALGVALLLVAAITVTGPGADRVPARADLRSVTGRLIGTDRACHRGVCRVELRLQTDATSLEITQQAFPSVDAAYVRLAVGADVAATVAPQPNADRPLGSDVVPDCFWGLERGGEPLLTVGQTAADSRAYAEGWRTTGYVVAAGGAVNLLGGLFGTRIRAWVMRRPAA